MHREERGAGKLGFSEQDFKVCDFCGALNRVQNNECFVCGWYGAFHTDSDTVKKAIQDFENKYGQLNENLIAEELLPDETPGPSWLSAIIERIKWFLSGRDTAE